MQFMKKLFSWYARTRQSKNLLKLKAPESPLQMQTGIKLSPQQIMEIMGALMKEQARKESAPEPILSPRTTAADSAPPANPFLGDSGGSNPFLGRSGDTSQVLGMVTPIECPIPQSMTPQQMAALDKLSKQMFTHLRDTRSSFLAAHPKLNFVESTYVVVDAAAALIADWHCSQEAAEKSPFDIPTAIMTSVEILQHNYMQKQRELYDRFGRFVH